MATGIDSQVTSLGDFPLDPDRGLAWLWTGDGARLLWMSEAAAADLAVGSGAAPGSISHGQSLESFAVELQNLQPDRQPIRVKQVPLTAGRRSELYTCLCRHVPLADGSGFGLLTVAIGAPPRLRSATPRVEDPQPREATGSQESASPAEAGEPALSATTAMPPETIVRDLRQAVATSAGPERQPAPPAGHVSEPLAPASAAVAPPPAASGERPPPNWTYLAPSQRRPYRFVWQTDRDGHFVHLSRELADAVGPASAMIMGRRLPEAATTLGLTETESVAAGFASRDTWTATPVLWPVADTDLGVPVEMAGMAVLESGRFAGFRGYGIARIERAIRMPGSARAALAGDALPERELDTDRFGPDISRRLGPATPDAAPAPLPPPVRSGRVEPALPAAREETAPAAADARQVVGEPMPRDAGQQSAMVDRPAAGLDSQDDRGLSPSERNAFREIARALGKDGAMPPPGPDDRPPASPRQMPAWIAQRQQARQQETRQQAAEPKREAPAPVVSFDALKARIDRRGREPFPGGGAALLDRLPLAVLVMQGGRPVYANAALLQLADHKDFASFLAAGGAESFFSGYIPEAGQRAANAITVRDRAGREHVVEAHVQSVSWDEAAASLIAFRKISPQAPATGSDEARMVELDLMGARAELRELRFVLDTATDGVLSLDSAGRILSANRSAEALFGFDQNEIAGEPFTVLLEPESHAAALDYLEGLRSDGVATIMNDGREVVGRERHGGRIPLFMTLGRMGGAKEATRFCAVLRDVTIWKKAEAELTDARRAAEDSSANKTDFLARVSHEIRTPMNAIIGFADVMRSESFGPLGNEKYKGYANDIYVSGQHVISLVNDLLDLSKVAAGKLDLTFGSVDLNQAVSACISMIQPQANAGQLIVRMQLAQKLPPVVADERSIRQIVLNLLSNAAKFTEPGGQVVVTTALTEKGEAVIRVRDTGIGMSPDDLKRALEPFRQVPGPKASGGTGLGLPLTKALAEANRASFVIGSEPGKGTLAEIVFPSTRVLAE